MISNKCNNTFWKDLLEAYKTLYAKIWSNENTHYKEMPIWYNTKICSYFNKEWFVNGISIVDNLFMNENFDSIICSISRE